MARSGSNRAAAGRERPSPSSGDGRDIVQAMGAWAGAFLAGLQPGGGSAPAPARPTELAFAVATEGAMLAGLLTRLGLETAKETARWLGQGLLDLAGPRATPGLPGPEPSVAGARWAPVVPRPGARARPGEEEAPVRRPADVQALAAGALPLLLRAAALAPGGLGRAGTVAGAAGRSLPAVIRGLQAAALARAAGQDALRERRPAKRP
ncbi:MAG TPA: hypothetical protein VFD49_10920 [Candidatus Dormibacteraeota bacterium]|nr:hypothetical protein [Candidatus Dormibacteraeota bacterium]